ncbi:hypothetical protein AVI51_01980 [Piscirickettsia salmonis]|uniref:hypothetical protein n=1 Tax=Piscirickettsia salmonis TaxID=1238 RepID=UPI000332C90D|nr:hypothetical protein [Piscirickettsia salmonis]ALA24824.1 protein phosphatase [Piscirickettsia salmonis]APS45147.1 hypothetical protein AVI48_12685 [Piscirickettsia salmonis]APS48507.1 hypothetical protein AVI49_13295 [Piscirickettsia salmonis]APS52952.1 hypothetical protein AVI51_01980 [Piscirickettsia salmonis]APS56226.1 hypothetical protein AVI52_02600 [Piscirickettsia salmonis]
MPGDEKKKAAKTSTRENQSSLIDSEASSLPPTLLFYTDSLSLIDQGQDIPIGSKKESSCPTCCLVM